MGKWDEKTTDMVSPTALNGFLCPTPAISRPRAIVVHVPQVAHGDAHALVLDYSVFGLAHARGQRGDLVAIELGALDVRLDCSGVVARQHVHVHRLPVEADCFVWFGRQRGAT